MKNVRAPRWAYLAAAALGGAWFLRLLWRRAGWWSARLLGHLLPDLPAESIDDVAMTAVRTARRVPWWMGRAGPTESVAAALWERGRYDEAVTYAGRILQMRRELGDRRGEGLALLYFGLAHVHAGDLDEALRQFELALPLAQEHLGPLYEPLFMWHIGRVQGWRGEWRVSLDWLERSHALYEDLGDHEHAQDTGEEIRQVRLEIDKPA